MRDTLPPPPNPAVQPRPDGGYATAGFVALGVLVLYLGRGIFIPLAVAVLLGFILAPLVLWLRRCGVPRIPSVVAVVIFAFFVLAGISVVVGAQVVELAENLPVYRQNISSKIASLQAIFTGPGVIDRVTDTLQDIGTAIEQAGPSADKGPGLAGRSSSPIPVVVSPAPTQPMEFVRNVLGPLLGSLATAGIVVVFVVFILIEREDLRDRFIKLTGGDLQRSTEAINEAASRVSRYLVMQLVVNVTYGIPVGVGLWLIGVPNAVLWGLLATILRFIPYLGPWLAALFPLALAFAVDPGWTMLLWTAALIITLEIVSNNVVEPLLYGASTGLSAFAIILAAIFWTTLWGPAGLFLATPLTVCLVVLGRYVPRLEFLGVLLGSDPVLAPEERFYQRLLAGNVVEALEIAEDHLKEGSPQDFYDVIAIPALRLAAMDRERSVDVANRRAVADAANEVIEEIGSLLDERRRGATSTGKEPGPQLTPRRPGRVLCIGGRTELDEVAASLLAQRVNELGLEAEALAPMAIGRTGIAQLDLDSVIAVCLCYLDPDPRAHARYACRRIARLGPGIDRIVCLLGLTTGTPVTENMRTAMGADALVASTEAAQERLLALAEQLSPTQPSPESLTLPDIHLIQHMRKVGLGSGRGPVFETVSDEIGASLEGALTMVLIVDPVTADAGGNGEAMGGRSVGDSVSPTIDFAVGREVMATGRPVVVADVSEDPRFESDAVLLEKGIRFFAGVPLRSKAGHVIGALAAFDSKPRAISDGERSRLQGIADGLMDRLEREAGEAEASSNPEDAQSPHGTSL
jgi:predicted PurR-regulated permease PerM/GAF domain-containing protein